MSKQIDSKKPSSAGGGAAASKSSAPAASGSAPCADTSGSPLDQATREKAALLFEGVDPDTIWAYREYDDKYVIVVMDGASTQKFECAK